MSRPVLDVTDWWEIATASDDDGWCRRSGKRAAVWDQPVVVELRPNGDLEAFMAAPLPPPPPPATDLRRNPDLEAMFA